MKKYLTVFTLSFQNDFTYRFNFILWRFRNVLRLLLTFFLWTVVFTGRDVAFGYTREQMLSYVFLVLIVQTLVMAAPSNDNVGGEIASGDLSNYLVKPMSYVKYWLTRDLSSKLLNLLFAICEISLLWLIFRPSLQLVSQPSSLILGSLVWATGILTYFFLTKAGVYAAFWIPENTWGLMFTILIFMEMLSGFIFPLDVLPSHLQAFVNLTPFPYLIYYPIAIFVGKVTGFAMFKILSMSLLWLYLSYILSRFVWTKGLTIYSAVGR